MKSRKSRFEPYIDLLRSFGHKEITAASFESQYLDMYKNDSTDWSEAEFEILEELFFAVDSFCLEDNLRDEDDLDENQLREACRNAWFKIHDHIANLTGSTN